jgi:hypothetical protein
VTSFDDALFVKPTWWSVESALGINICWFEKGDVLVLLPEPEPVKLAGLPTSGPEELGVTASKSTLIQSIDNIRGTDRQLGQL